MSETKKNSYSNSQDMVGFDYEKDYDYDNSCDYEDELQINKQEDHQLQKQSAEIVSPGLDPSAERTAVFIPLSERSLEK
jgi:membrane-bound lytic murein transglycosylase MltF